MAKKYNAWLFVLAVTAISFFYNYQEIIFKRPQSVHKWRQADCASIALNYYQGGMHFFDIQTHNLTSDNGSSGASCTSEVPLLYYAVALLYKIFGYHDSVFRMLNTLLFFLGLFFLFRMFDYLLRDTFWSLTLSLLFFTSPVLVYYGNNFLSNSPALAFAIGGWYYFTRYVFEHKSRLFYISAAFFLLAAMLKVTALFSLFAITGILAFEWTGILQIEPGRRIFRHPTLQTGIIVSIVALVSLWLVHAHYFNQKHDCSYFSTTIFPMWDMNKEQVKGVIDNVKKMWLPEYFHASVILFVAACFIFLLAFFRKSAKFLSISVLVVFAECIVYIVLQFWTFADHDYYTIDMYILPILIVISAFDLLKRHYSSIFHSLITKLVFSIFLLFNVYYAQQRLSQRYNGWMNDYPENKDFYTITPYLRQIGISAGDTVIALPDVSHVSLYLMNQKGWTEYTDAKFNRAAAVRYNQDSAGIATSIRKGAKYLIINGLNEIYKRPFLNSFCTHLKGQYRKILIFDLRDKTTNFNPAARKLFYTLYCDAETRSSDKTLFIGKPDSTTFQNAETQTAEMAHTGRYAVKLSAASPYGMTIRLKALQYGESFEISAWRNAKGKLKGGLVSSSSPTTYYNSDYQVMETEPSGWEKIRMQVSVPAELQGQELVVYVYNPDPEAVYFDDLEIRRFKSAFNADGR